MHGYRDAKFEVLQFFLRYAREQFQIEIAEVIKDMVRNRSKRKAEALAAARAGTVTSHEIESMRSMLNMGELTCRKKIADYMLDFKMGNTGSRALQQTLPTFLMFKYITRDRMSDIIKSANRRGRAHEGKQDNRYFRLGSLVSLMDGAHPMEQMHAASQLSRSRQSSQISVSAYNNRRPSTVNTNGWVGANGQGGGSQRRASLTKAGRKGERRESVTLYDISETKRTEVVRKILPGSGRPQPGGGAAAAGRVGKKNQRGGARGGRSRPAPRAAW